MAEQEKSLTDLDEVVRLANLYDFYGPLLKDKQQQIFEQYILDDLSLGEIANEYDITRQGVYDIVKRCSRKLEGYEDKLQLYYKFGIAKERLKQLEDLVKHDRVADKNRILSLTHDIYDIL